MVEGSILLGSNPRGPELVATDGLGQIAIDRQTVDFFTRELPEPALGFTESFDLREPLRSRFL